MPDGEILAGAQGVRRVGRSEDTRLALMALFIANTSHAGATCAEMVDEATRLASTARREVTKAAGLVDPVARRFGAARVLNSLCGACRMCPRGALGKTANAIMVRRPQGSPAP